MGKLDDTCTQLQLVNGPDATETLDEAIGALNLAFDAVLGEAGPNQTLSCAFSCMALAIKSLKDLRGTMAAAKNAPTLESRDRMRPGRKADKRPTSTHNNVTAIRTIQRSAPDGDSTVDAGLCS